MNDKKIKNAFSDINENLVIVQMCLHYLSERFTELSASAKENEKNKAIAERFEKNLRIVEKLQADILTIHVGKAQDQRFAVPMADLAVSDTGMQNFREAIVNLMILSLQCWEQSTRQSKLELAEQSKLWSIYNNNGCLATRTMDRYLRLSTLPKRPRSNTVVKTAYFVLEKSPEDIPIKKELQDSVFFTQKWVQTQALSNTQH
ncbi:MAG: hypothetical protein V3T17_17305 [Pseudomonadales bacterium]